MKNNNRLAGGLAVFGSLLGIIGTYLIFMNWFTPAMTAEAAEPGCELLLKYLMPALSDFGILAGALYAVSAYGYFTSAKWAFPVVVLANVLALQGSWFINVPMMAAGLPPIYFIVFWPNLILYFLFVKGIQGLSWSRTLLGLLAGATFIFCFMNGVASWSRILTIGSHIFVIVQRLNWVASIALAVVTVGLLLQPLAINTTIGLGRFSLFSFGPIFSLILIVLIIWPNLWEKMTGTSEDKVTAQQV